MRAAIRNLYLRNFRSARQTSVTGCGGLNIFIGRNNAGKSNLLTTITLSFGHFERAGITSAWRSPRIVDEFFGKNTELPIYIGLEMELPRETNHSLRAQMRTVAPQLDRAIDDLERQTTIAFVLRGEYNRDDPFIFLQDVAIGHIADDDPDALSTNGFSLLHVDFAVARELHIVRTQYEKNRRELTAVEAILRRGVPDYFLRERDYPIRGFLRERDIDVPRETEQRIEQIRRGVQGNVEQFTGLVNQYAVELREQGDKIEASPVSPMRIFSGETRTTPDYIKWLTSQYASIPRLHLTENKKPIGPEEAQQLLNLKVRRGGSERLTEVQKTVENLLGVTLDAFQAESGRDRAEMDVDDFLAEANGAGVREALRLILDLELKQPSLVLIEEPEVHLHPGLEYAVHSYLRHQSRDAQLFVTTHSTNFVDFVSFQNVYLVSRDADRKTVCEHIDAGEAPLRISEELGLRLSTVFMYDRLVFVEGPSDELVLRECAQKLGLDLVRANVGFVHMRGIKNFAHYAAHHTLDLLTNRQVKMWFIADRDEMKEDEVLAMKKRLGTAAEMKVLARRELENYLLDPKAVTALLSEKLKTSANKVAGATISQAELQAAAASQKETVVKLSLVKVLLGPIYPSSVKYGVTPNERLTASVAALQDRLAAAETVEKDIRAEVAKVWPDQALDITPGSIILDIALQKYGVRFKKDDGDSARLAGHLDEEDVPSEIRQLLEEISAN
jgi:putative ATP-dependent endonuclease of the OLD family